MTHKEAIVIQETEPNIREQSKEYSDNELDNVEQQSKFATSIRKSKNRNMNPLDDLD